MPTIIIIDSTIFFSFRSQDVHLYTQREKIIVNVIEKELKRKIENQKEKPLNGSETKVLSNKRLFLLCKYI